MTASERELGGLVQESPLDVVAVTDVTGAGWTAVVALHGDRLGWAAATEQWPARWASSRRRTA